MPRTSDETETDSLQRLAVELLVDSSRFTRVAARRASTEMSAALWRGLSQIEELGPLRITDLAAADRCSQPTATNLVQRLSERGWISRSADPDDARAVLVEITDSGREVLEAQRSQAGRALVPALAALDPEDRRRLADGLVALRRLLSVQLSD
ncbi:MAG: MarR family winged helix-turn-helix transcriptional regulator [Actinomycetes bacterium]